MAIATVKPGDVISSNFFNDLINMINDLETRLTTIEQGGVIVAPGRIIDHFDPPAQIEIGRVLTMFGSFDFPPESNAVTVDGVSVNPPGPGFRPGSNNLQLLFIVPTTISAPPPGGRDVAIRVTNSRGTDQKSYRLLPALPSTVPAPTITSVVDLASSTAILVTGQAARITGTNFATNPTDNIVKFKVNTGTTTVTYPTTGGLTVDTTQTTTTQIVVTVPVITQIAVGSSLPAVVEVGVGSAVPAAFAITVLRV